MATDPTTLLELSKCYNCYGSAGVWNLFELGLWKAYLLTLDPVADTSPNALLESAKCYDCYGAPGEWQLFKLGLLQKILLAITPGADTSADALLESAKCYDCYGGGGMWMLLELGLLNQISAGGGGSCPQDMQVAWTPTNVKLGEIMGFFQYTDLPGITGTLTFDQVNMLGGVDIEPGLTGATGVTAISFPNLIDIDPTGAFSGYLSLIGFPNLVSVSAPVLVTFGNNMAISNNPSLTTVNFSSFIPTDGKTVSFSGNALLAASVNSILHRCVANAAYVSGTVDVSGGTNAAPSGAGIADKATLIGRGVTVNTN